MATNLKHSADGLMEAFEHHLVYEINMLRHTFAFLHIRAWSPELLNAIIESFCVHARNLVDFFDQKSATAGQAQRDYVGARHFCNQSYQPWTKGRPSNELYGRLNRQVSHLTYDRTAQAKEKIGGKEQLELFKSIEQELEIFERSLREPYASKWPFKRIGSSETKITIEDSPLGATNHTTSVASSHIGGATGTTAPGPKLVIRD